MPFTHLHVHTEYSLLDGSNKIKEYVAQVKKLGMTSAAITDHGVMYGCIDFYKAAAAAGIKPILGCEVYVAPGSRFDKEQNARDDRYYHLVLLAENNTGYAHLMKIVSAGFVDGFYYRPRVDKEILRKYHEGIIALSACLAGEIPRAIARGDYNAAKASAYEYRDIFGDGNFFLELQDHGIPEQKHVNMQLIRMHEEEGFPLVCTNDVHYTYKEDAEPHDILLCIQTAKKVTDEDRMRYEGGQYFVKSEEEMRALFSYIPEAIENTGKIAERCNVTITFGERKLPKFDVPEGYDSWSYLNMLCRKGLKEKYSHVTSVLTQRLDYELSTIRSMGFVDYFLIVWDYVKFAKDHDIIVGPGRGSAAGSLVSYTLGITELDPLKYNLIFERFLNPERITMPDIDVDFCFEHRQDVIDYVVGKYGKDRVVQIVTFGTMAARGVIRDVARALDFPYSEADEIAKMIPKELNITLDKALEMNPDLKQRYLEDDEVHKLITMAKRLEGLPRNTSMHAAGVVISQKPVVEYVPLSRAADGSITTQYTMTALEELGLLKMDFLGLRTLTVVQNAVKLVNRRLPEKNLDLKNIDYNDPAVMEMIGKGKTEGVFQLESSGMKAFMKELKPKSLEDIIAGIALYRPGPMDFIPRYIEGKEHPESVTYECREMKPILAPTYGCIVYQEQVMQIVRDLGGYSMGRSDLVRRAMSKKKASVMEKERRNFVFGNPEEGVPGCIKRGIKEEVANKIFDQMTDFANYAFNKSHAAAYAVISMQTAFLKYYYPVEFMAALMTSVIDNPDKCAEYILHCREMKIKILPPSVNSGLGPFTSEDGKIRYGLYAIKSIGRGVIDMIVSERTARGPYASIRDFIDRTYGKDINKRAIENLIKAGALDGLGGTRKQLMQVYARVLDAAAADSKEKMDGQLSLFDFMSPETKQQFEIRLPEVGEYSKEEKLAFEKEVLGVYLSGHPLEDWTDLLRMHVSAVSSDFMPDEETNEPKVENGAREIIGGMITAKTIKYTKNNKTMAFITVEDLVGSVEVLVFPKVYEQYKTQLVEDSKIFVEGRVSAEDEKPSKLICDKITPFDEIPRELWIAFPDSEAWEDAKDELMGLISESDGIDPVFIYLKDKKAYRKLPEGFTVKITGEMLETLKKIYGDGCVTVRITRKSVEK
ncbi:MAG TPA: DNA polymerase III subunit alpha [Lachnospiraceae bacterium]|nr:DNA polymerase III subunit alpha [Lachnospiraceae bacterium]